MASGIDRYKVSCCHKRSFPVFCFGVCLIAKNLELNLTLGRGGARVERRMRGSPPRLVELCPTS